MDGRVLLLVFAGLVGGIVLLGGRTFDLPDVGIPLGQSGLVASTGGAVQGDRSDPNTFVVDKSGVPQARGPIAATEHLTAAFVGKVLDGHRRSGATAPPIALIPVEPQQFCRFSPPEQGSRVVNLVAMGRGLDTKTYIYSDAQLQERTENFLKDLQSDGRAEVPVYPNSFELEGVDIAVSETEYPVHLVLHSGAKTLWNVHLRPGARVTGVSMIGGRVAAISGLPSGTPVQALLKEQLVDCKISPVTRPLVNPVFLSSVKIGVISKEEAEETISNWQEMERRYNVWFKGQFGIPATTTRVGYENGPVFLVGPLPTDETELVPFRDLQEKTLLYVSGETITRGTAADFRDEFRGKVRALAMRVSGGNLQGVALGGGN
ncbi:MAG: hypothetical protein AAFQ66_09070 [Pseudomonadota bacterium]